MTRIARRAFVAALVLLTTTYGPVGAKPDQNRVTSISPAAAEPGAVVTVMGRGFGARNVRITVGEIPAEVISATGSRATFGVPASAPIGRTTVTVRNPGGQGGSIAFEVLAPPFDGEVTPTLNTGAAVSATIGPEGGAISAGGAVLSIPPGAVPVPTLITVTPLSGIAGSPLAGIVGGALFEPDGLHLVQPATFSVPAPPGAAPGSLIGFAFEGAGTDFHLLPASVADGLASIVVSHFSGGGVAVPTQAEINQVMTYQPTPGQASAEQAIAAALANGSLSNELRLDAIAAALRAWYQQSVNHGLQISATERIEFFELAIGEWFGWLGMIQEYGVDDRLAPEMQTAQAQALIAAKAQARAHLDRCTGVGDLRAPFRALLRLAGTLNLWDAPIGEGNSGLPAAAALDTSCMWVEIDGVAYPPAFASDRQNAFGADASAHFFNGPTRFDVPLSMELADATDGPPVGIASETVTNGRWRTTVRPTGQGLRRFGVTARLPGADTDDAIDALSTSESFTAAVRPRLVLEAAGPDDSGFTDRPATVPGGTNVALRIRLAGDDMAGAGVDLNLTGDGALSTTAVTTNSNGEAALSYTAPSACGTATIMASREESVGESTDAVSVTTELPVTGITVSPGSPTLQPGASRQFSATVTGGCSQEVIWSATGGAISADGLYTAGQTTGTFAVRARSAETADVVGVATVTVQDVTYLGGRITASGHLESRQSSSDSQWLLDVVARVEPDGSLVVAEIAGTYAFDGRRYFPPCDLFDHTTGTVTGGLFRTTRDPSVILLTLFARFVSETVDCNGAVWSHEETGPQQSTSLVGRPVYQDGRLVALDFNSSEEFTFPSGQSSSVQTGDLLPVDGPPPPPPPPPGGGDGGGFEGGV